MSRWRKKQVVIDAWQFMPAGRREEVPPWIDPQWFHQDLSPDADRTVEDRGTAYMLIPTPGGALRADLTDWIIRGVKGEVYPCKADVFEASYERAR
ncbi:MAG TPA: hypothetical protein VKT54_09495 [Steroidobacteraceae bacterium]|nr:hypothetical protein [Steroidobacteraceae bacterium]